MQLELEPEEIQSILNVLGELPTKANAWPLRQKIAQQVNAHAPALEPVEEPEQEEAA